MKDKLEIRDVQPDQAEALADIYYITRTIITFEETAVSSVEISQRIQNIQSSGLPWLVAEQGGEILGWAYAGQWKERYAYRFSTETTVYVKPDEMGHGIGTALYSRLLPVLKNRGLHAALSVIALPNEASVGLHEKFGFFKAAHLKEVGFKFNRWIDVGYWQKIL